MKGTRLVVEPVKSLFFGGIATGYMGIGTAFEYSARMVLVNNLTDAVLFFSYDGFTDHFSMPPFSSLLLTLTINDEEEDSFSLPAQSRLYVKYLTLPTEGSVYVTQFRGITDA